ncbi:MAG: peptide chain release factor N(5)-glutamine methyltransferase [Gammaproteobacteria bacterium]|nr:peptide chain release factor N(5)-glutamine methyltransferase [Gammaproteobacteria bacterium]
MNGLLTNAAKQLQSISTTPRLDNEILLAHVLKKSRGFLYSHPEYELTDRENETFQALIVRRLAGEPIAYITEHKEFWSLDFKVNSDTLIPRPETELLVELALERIPTNSNNAIKVADLGTGSGAIALAIANTRSDIKITATDISAKALKVAQENASHLKLNNVNFILNNWCEALDNSAFDIIISNPPYVAENELQTSTKYEPISALVAKDNGLSALRTIIRTAPAALKNNGWLILEHGFTQAKAVQNLLREHKYSEVSSFKDLAGHLRATIGRKLEY